LVAQKDSLLIFTNLENGTSAHFNNYNIFHQRPHRYLERQTRMRREELTVLKLLEGEVFPIGGLSVLVLDNEVVVAIWIIVFGVPLDLLGALIPEINSMDALSTFLKLGQESFS